MLICISIIDKPKQPTRVINGIELLENICKAMPVHNNLQPHVAVLDWKNIDIFNKKPLYQWLIQKNTT